MAAAVCYTRARDRCMANDMPGRRVLRCMPVCHTGWCASDGVRGLRGAVFSACWPPISPRGMCCQSRTKQQMHCLHTRLESCRLVHRVALHSLSRRQ
jgi:hypothetical protein